MANLKADLLNELRNQKYYAELELLRLAQDPAMNYREKILDISDQLGLIAILNNKIALADGYFQDAPVEPPQGVPLVDETVPQPPMETKVEEAPAELPQQPAQPLPGQSHAE